VSCVDCDEVLVAQAGEQLDEPEGVAVHALCESEDGGVGRGAEDVGRNVGNRGLVEALEGRLAGAVA
jgi:hypothetical protein